MPTDHAAIADTISQYAAAVGDAVEATGGLVEWLRSLANPKARARRLRRRSARLWRVANRAAGRGYRARAADLRARAVDAWAEAQRIDPLTVAAAVLADAGAA